MSQQIQKVRSFKKTYKPLAQRPLAPKPAPLAQSPLAPRPISTSHLQSQNCFEMTPNPNNILMGYGTGTFMVRTKFRTKAVQFAIKNKEILLDKFCTTQTDRKIRPNDFEQGL